MEKRKILILLGFIGIVYFLFLLFYIEFILNNYDPISQTISELGARDSKYSFMVNYIGFLVLGIAIMIFSLGFKEEFNHRLNTKISFYFLFIGGFFMSLVGLFPCDSGCVNLTPLSKFHYYVAAVPALLIPLAAIISSFEISKKWGNNWGSLSLLLGIFSVICGPLMFFPSFLSYMGFIERFGLALGIFWIFLITFGLFKESIQKV